METDSADAPADARMVVVVQCEKVVGEACSGYHCEWAFSTRADAFKDYPAEGTPDGRVRYLSMTCGGCPGRAVLRKLMNLKKSLRKRERSGIANVTVHLSTCIAQASHHGPACPFRGYIEGQVERAGFKWLPGSRYSPKAVERRAEGKYNS